MFSYQKLKWCQKGFVKYIHVCSPTPITKTHIEEEKLAGIIFCSSMVNMGTRFTCIAQQYTHCSQFAYQISEFTVQNWHYIYTHTEIFLSTNFAMQIL